MIRFAAGIAGRIIGLAIVKAFLRSRESSKELSSFFICKIEGISIKLNNTTVLKHNK